MKIRALTTVTTSRPLCVIPSTREVLETVKDKRTKKETEVTKTVDCMVYKMSEGTVKYSEGDVFTVVEETNTRYIFRSEGRGIISADKANFEVV